MAELIQHIQQRQSTPIVTDPAPSLHQWHQVIQTACTAPDHGKLRPWHFRLIEGETSLKHLGDVFAKAQTHAYSLKGETPTEQQLQRSRELPLRAPSILVVVAQIIPDHKIPVIEQIAATAAATQNAQLALTDLGFGCIWRTGEFAFSDAVKAALGFQAQDAIIGFLYVGTPSKQPPARTPQPIASCFKAWSGVAST